MADDGTERVTQIWPKSLKDRVREKAGSITEFTVEAVELHLGVSQDLAGLRKELGETRYFAQQMADQIVLGIESPEERLQALMELEFPSWIDTSGWPETYAARVRPDLPVSEEPVIPEPSVVLDAVDEVIEVVGDAVVVTPEIDRKVETIVEEVFTPPKIEKSRDDLFARVMAKTDGKLADVPGLQLASDLPKPDPKIEDCEIEEPHIHDNQTGEVVTEKIAQRRIDLEDIEVEF